MTNLQNTLYDAKIFQGYNSAIAAVEAANHQMNGAFYHHVSYDGGYIVVAYGKAGNVLGYL